MRRKMVLVIVTALALALPAVARAQSKPDFSGSWTLDQSKSDPPPMRGGGGGGGGGREGRGRGGFGGGAQTIRQSGNELSITSEGRGGPQTMTYKLDGSESTNKVMGRGGEMDAKSKARWDGSKLVIGLLVVVLAVSHATLQVPEPHGRRWRTPVDENQSLTATPVLPSSELTGGVVFRVRPNIVENVGV